MCRRVKVSADRSIGINMDKEKQTDIVRNVLWALLLVAALVWGIAAGHWKPFIVLAVMFVSVKVPLLLRMRKLHKLTQTLEGMLKEQGQPSYVPEPSVIDAMQKKAKTISDEINRLCPPQECLSFAIDMERTPTIFDSKLGGCPYWDGRQPYPTDENGRPMAMVIQVNLGNCPHVEPLPSSGMLQFFITSDESVLEEGYGTDYENPTSQRCFRVVYHKMVDPSIDPQQMGQFPVCERLENTPVFGEYAISVSKDASCVNRTCENFDKLFATAINQLYGDEMETPYIDDYLKKDLPEEYRDKVSDALVIGDNPMHCFPLGSHFQMLGFPAFEQYDEREAGSRYGTLLLQIPTISSTEGEEWHTIWGDCGSARLFINADDLRRCDFSDVYYEYQCY